MSVGYREEFGNLEAVYCSVSVRVGRGRESVSTGVIIVCGTERRRKSVRGRNDTRWFSV